MISSSLPITASRPPPPHSPPSPSSIIQSHGFNCDGRRLCLAPSVAVLHADDRSRSYYAVPNFLRYIIMLPMSQSWRQQDNATARYPVQAEGVTVWSCRPTQSRYSCTPNPMDADGPLHWSEDPTSDGDGNLVDHVRPGVPRSGPMLECHLVTTGTPVSTLDTVG